MVALVRLPRQIALPVGGQQAQGIPALLAPGVRDFTALQNHVVYCRATEAMTDRLVANGFGIAVQEDIFGYLVDENIISI